MTKTDLVGTVFFAGHADTFIEVMRVDDVFDIEGRGQPMAYRDLRDGTEHEDGFVGEIGTRFLYVPPDMTREDIGVFCQAANESARLSAIVHDVGWNIRLSIGADTGDWSRWAGPADGKWPAASDL